MTELASRIEAAAHLGEELSVDERLIVSPCEGRFRPAPAQNYTVEGEYVLEGQVVGHVADPSGELVPVHSRFDGWVMDFLVRDGSPVAAGEPVIWLRRL